MTSASSSSSAANTSSSFTSSLNDRFGNVRPSSLIIAAGIGLVAGAVIGSVVEWWRAPRSDALPSEDARAVFEEAQANEDKRYVTVKQRVKNASLTYRQALLADIPALAQQWFESYNSSAAALGAPPLFATVEQASTVVKAYVESKTGLLACSVDDGRIMASAFQDENDVETGVVGCGPWTVTWNTVSQGVGRALLSHVISQSLSRGAKSLRLLQGPTNLSSYALYVRLGFQIRETLTFFTGILQPSTIEPVLALNPSWVLSEWQESDLDELTAFWQKGTNTIRKKTLQQIFKDKTRKCKRFVLKHNNQIIAFTTGFGSMGSSGAVSNAAFKHLLCAATLIHQAEGATTKGVPLMFHGCARINGELTRWAIEHGLRIGRTANLMVLGEWTPIPTDSFVYCPSTELS